MNTAVQPHTAAKHTDCARMCMQAVDYGVWPLYSCSPRCVLLDKAAAEYQRDAIASANSAMPDNEPGEL